MRIISLSLIILLSVSLETTHAQVWKLHTIDASSRGADGVRLGDINQDGLPDITTGWEEGGQIRVCLHPGHNKATEKWPSVTVGKVKSPEDAVFADIDGDGLLDVVSCCEGNQQTVNLHFNPGTSELLAPDKWRTQIVDATAKKSRWMFCAPMKARQQTVFVLGSKKPNAQISLLDAQKSPAMISKIRDCGWIMSVRLLDLDHDGDLDILYSDRYGDRRGIGWLETPNARSVGFRDHFIFGSDLQVMFLDAAQVEKRWNIFANTRDGFVLHLAQAVNGEWKPVRIPHPKGTGQGKGVAAGDLDGDGDLDLACTCEHAEGLVGAFWMESVDGLWKFHDVSGAKQGIKYDRIELIDLDGDSDLDLLTCEERDNLGVIWYENPLK
ncbi:MAG TPA: hypothetical protein DCG12_22920 [Planctomycetaceae bacterium]|nr:hypothetical protein [Planctomycetaceae bacterium]